MDVSPITLRDARRLHDEALTKLDGLASSTRRNYRSVYNTLATYLAPRFPDREPLTTDLNYEVVESYFMDHVSVHAPAAYSLRRTNLIAIVKWLMKKGYLEWGHNFAEDIPTRKKTGKTTRTRRLSDEEFLNLLKAARASHVRDYFLCLFMRFCGRRIGEVVGEREGNHGMTWGDIRWNEDHILWDNTKAGRLGQQMPLTPRLREILLAWKEAYCRELGVDDVRLHWRLFPALTAAGAVRTGRKRGRRLAPEHKLTNPARVCHDLLTAAGLWERPGDGWHIIRKTFGNQRKQKASQDQRPDAWDLTAASLDHSDTSTSQIYVDARDEYDRYAAWAMGAEEMSWEAMAKIPELSALARAALAAPETPKAAARERDDSTSVDPSDDVSSEIPTNVIPLSSRRALRALG